MDDWLIIKEIEDVVAGTSIPYNYERVKLSYQKGLRFSSIFAEKRSPSIYHTAGWPAYSFQLTARSRPVMKRR